MKLASMIAGLFTEDLLKKRRSPMIRKRETQSSEKAKQICPHLLALQAFAPVARNLEGEDSYVRSSSTARCSRVDSFSEFS
ncbi:unnamed protein product [Amoebophrya sp. A25]|nr:unnamed protein product [Amoebophrya sp. A25]|eukprot:GSA25T00008220001.1